MSGESPEDLLQRTRELRRRIDARNAAAAETLDDLGWLAARIRAVRAGLERLAAVFAFARPVTRALWLVLSPGWRAFRTTAAFLTCNRDARGERTLAELSWARVGASFAMLLTLWLGLLGAYAYGTRVRGRFIISNYQLVDAGEDTYQVGGCPKRRADQVECEPGDSEIMLVEPDWLSSVVQIFGVEEGVLGIDAFLFDEIAGGIPQQGECELSRYGIYFRPPPLFRLLRGATKPHVVYVGTCEIYGVRSTPSRGPSELPLSD